MTEQSQQLQALTRTCSVLHHAVCQPVLHQIRRMLCCTFSSCCLHGKPWHLFAGCELRVASVWACSSLAETAAQWVRSSPTHPVFHALRLRHARPMQEERNSFGLLLDECRLVDGFRRQYPDVTGYT